MIIQTMRRWWNTPVRPASLAMHFGLTAAAAFIFICMVLMGNLAVAYHNDDTQARDVCEKYWDCHRGVPKPRPVQEDQ